MEIVNVANLIESKINELNNGLKMLNEIGAESALKQAEFDVKLAQALIKLKNGEEVEVKGDTVINPPATIMGKIAVGSVWKEKLDADVAEKRYKNAMEKMDILKAQLMGWQSIFRHLDNK